MRYYLASFTSKCIYFQNNGPQQLASEATIYVVLEDVNDEIPLFTEREQETVLEGEPIGTKVTQVNAIDKDGTYPNNEVSVAYIEEWTQLHLKEYCFRKKITDLN